MKKIMKTSTVINMYETLFLIVQNNNRKLPGKITWAIHLTVQNLEAIHKSYTDMRDKILDEFRQEGKTEIINEKGDYQILPKYNTEFLNYFKEIGDAEIEVELYAITPELFDLLLEGYELSGQEVACIDYLVDREAEK